MTGYIPVKFAKVIVEPNTGVDESLNPILFLHGFSGTKELWHDIPQKICDLTQRRAYLFDARCHGDSEYTELFTFNLIVEDLLYFMETNNISKAIFIGHSMGGWSAARVALKHPEKVELLIMEDIGIHKVTKEIARNTLGFVHLWSDAVRKIPSHFNMKEGIKVAVNHIFKMIPPEAISIHTPKELQYKCDFSLRRNNKGYEIKLHMPAIIKSLRDLEVFSTQPEGLFKGPVAVILGKLSPFRGEMDTDLIKKHMPSAEIFEIDGAAHNVHIDQYDIYMDTVIKFLKKHNKLS